MEGFNLSKKNVPKIENRSISGSMTKMVVRQLLFISDSLLNLAGNLNGENLFWGLRENTMFYVVQGYLGIESHSPEWHVGILTTTSPGIVCHRSRSLHGWKLNQIIHPDDKKNSNQQQIVLTVKVCFFFSRKIIDDKYCIAEFSIKNPAEDLLLTEASCLWMKRISNWISLIDCSSLSV